jgi:hypothetical protein
MSRTRLLRPDFFKDERMAALAITSRYVYMGLWTLCDDAGYFELKPRQIAAELFPYEGPARRQRMVDGCLADLVALGRVKYLDCGEHGVVPTLPKHGAKGGTKAETHLARHRSTCMSVRVRTTADLSSDGQKSGRVRTSPDKSSSDSGSDSDSGMVEERADARALEHAAAEAGGFVAGLAARRNGAKGVEPTPEEPAWMGEAAPEPTS